MNTLAFIKNSSRNIDPIKYSANIGEFAQLLLLYDKISIVTNHYSEIPCLINWLGEDNFHELIRKEEINFILCPWDYYINNRERENEVSIGLMKLLGKEIDVDFNKEEDKILLLHNIVTTHHLLPDNFSVSPETIKLIANKTQTIDSSLFTKTLSSKSNTTLNWLFSSDNDAVITSYLEHPFLYRNIIDSIKDNNIILKERNSFSGENIDYLNKYFQNDLINILYSLRELLIASFTNTNYLNASNFTQLLVPNLINNISEDHISKIFEEIITVHKLPLVHSGVFNGKINADNILTIRNSKSSYKFRNWLEQASSKSFDSTSIIQEYMASIEDQVDRKSITYSFFRLLSSTVLGLFDAGTGLAFSLYDTYRTEKNKRWSPILFIRDEYKKCFSQSSYDLPKIPIDLLFLINKGYTIKSFVQTSDNTRVELYYLSEADRTNFSYSNDSIDREYIRSVIIDVIKLSPGTTFNLFCNNCGSFNRIMSTGKELKNIKCGCCKYEI